MTFFENIQKIIQLYWPSLLLGTKTTLIISLTGTIFGLIIGLFVGGIRAIKLDRQAPASTRFAKKTFDVCSSLYITFFRGTPMMAQAFFIYYALLKVIHWTYFQAAIVIISINTGAYMAEMVRSGIQSVDIGQTEAARSLGMSNMQTMMKIILPQAIRNAFPAIGNEFIVNIKDSCVLTIISITEIMFQARSIAGSTYLFTETAFIECCIYLFLTSVTSLILNWIEKQLNKQSHSLPQSVTLPQTMLYSARKEDQ